MQVLRLKRAMSLAKFSNILQLRQMAIHFFKRFAHQSSYFIERSPGNLVGLKSMPKGLIDKFSSIKQRPINIKENCLYFLHISSSKPVSTSRAFANGQ